MNATHSATDIRPAFVSKGKLVIYFLMFTFWMLGVYPFIVQLFSYQVYQSIDLRVMGFFEMAYLVLGILLLRSKSDIWIFLSFLVMAFLDTVVINELPPIEVFNGVRFYLPLLMMLPVIRYATATRERREFFFELMDRSLYIFLWLQGPCMIYQLVVFGGWDYGGGSLGFGESGVCSELIYMISFYLMLRRWDYKQNYLRNIGRNWILIFLLYPSLLNETKASLLFIALYFICLIPFNKKMIKSLIITIPVVIGAIFLFNSVYQSLYGKAGRNTDILSKEYFDYYVLGDDISADLIEMAYEHSDMEENVDFQRGLKWAALPWLMDDEGAQSWFWGNGTGIDKGHSELQPSRFAQSYRWLLYGTQMTLEMLMLECGIWGVVWLIAAMVVLFRGWYRHVRHQKQLTAFLVGMLVAVLFYNTSMNIIIFCLVFYYMAYLSSRWDEVREFKNIDSSGKMMTLGNIFKPVAVSGENSDGEKREN